MVESLMGAAMAGVTDVQIMDTQACLGHGVLLMAWETRLAVQAEKIMARPGNVVIHHAVER